jgi:hypothetical protein
LWGRHSAEGDRGKMELILVVVSKAVLILVVVSKAVLILR